MRLGLGDLGAVEDKWSEPRRLARYNGQEAVTFNFLRSREASEVKVAERVREEVARIDEAHPELTIEQVTSSVQYIEESYLASLEALGLGALVIAFPQVFRVIAVLGALYVAWLGLKALQGAFRTAAEPDRILVRRGRSAFIDGFAVQIANPKAILFFTAVLPPFLDVDRPVVPQLVLFAAAVIGMDMLSMSAYALSGAALSRRMQQPRFRRGFGVFVGLLLLTAAVLIVART